MIIMAVLAPVLIMGMLAVGATMMAVGVVSIAAVGGVVAGVTDRAYYAVTRKRAARRRAVGDNVVAWPRPTARGEAVEGAPETEEQAMPQRWAARAAVAGVPAPVSRAAGCDETWERVVGFEPWEEFIPFEEPDFEQVVTYTLVAGSDF